MKQFLFFAGALLLLVACNKDKFQTKPQLKLVSVSSEEVPVNSDLKVVLQFTDKEGDVSDTMFITKQRLNTHVETTVRDTMEFAIAEFPKSRKGEFEINLSYQNELISAQTPRRIPGSDPPKFEPDTLRIKFVAKDKGGNKSDSLILNNIIVLR